MKWKAKPIPQDGDERWTLRFALVPHRSNDGYWHWLTDLYVRQRYFEGLSHHYWISIEYSDKLP